MLMICITKTNYAANFYYSFKYRRRWERYRQLSSCQVHSNPLAWWRDNIAASRESGCNNENEKATMTTWSMSTRRNYTDSLLLSTRGGPVCGDYSHLCGSAISGSWWTKAKMELSTNVFVSDMVETSINRFQCYPGRVKFHRVIEGIRRRKNTRLEKAPYRVIVATMLDLVQRTMQMGAEPFC